MTQQRRFMKEFEEEAVRLVRTSGRSQREIAEDLGIGLSTLVRWIGRSRDWQIDEPGRPGQEDVVAELKRLRRDLIARTGGLEVATQGVRGQVCVPAAWMPVCRSKRTPSAGTTSRSSSTE